ncbi:hypothetical protein [Shewanella xiamenensis]|uniref:hypothetical protein n=1 Tax=Shewanella xiamenensis TaxID=332186 RepID=UPI0021BE37B3|nr:hypothetical protein [Shewanella xiamenensis]MCT8866321.1 hypothetical protein [Shewanella xiamenensis]
MNTLRTNFKLKTSDSEADVCVQNEQFPVGSICAHEIVKLLNQKGDVLIHEFKRINKDKQIVTKKYTFNREHVQSFAEQHMINLEMLSISNDDIINWLRNPPNKK